MMPGGQGAGHLLPLACTLWLACDQPQALRLIAGSPLLLSDRYDVGAPA